MAEKYIQITDNTGAPATPIAGKVKLYQEGNDLKVIDSLGAITNLTEVAAGGAGTDYYIPNEILVDPAGATVTGKSYTDLAPAVAYANANATFTAPIVIKIGTYVTVAVNIVITSPYVSIHGNGYAEATIKFDDSLAGSTCLAFNLASTSSSLINGRLKDIRIVGSAALQSAANTVGVSYDGTGIFYNDSVTYREFNTNVHVKYTGVDFTRVLIQNSYSARSTAVGIKVSNAALLTLINVNINSIGSGVGLQVEDAAVLYYAIGEIANVITGTGTGLKLLGGGGEFEHFVSGVRLNNLSLGLEALAIGQPDQTIEMSGCKFENNTQDAYAEGTPFTIDSNGNVVDFSKVVFNPAAIPNVVGNFRDRTVNDKGSKFYEELAVGSPLNPQESIFGEGDSYVTGMLIYTFDTATYTNVFEDAKNPIDGNTVSFPGLAADNAIYLSNGYGKQFQGLKIKINQIANLGSGDIVFEYWNGSSWAAVSHMTTSVDGAYQPYADSKFDIEGFFHIRVNETIIRDWIANDPASLGFNSFWMRLRISTAINQTPTFDQFKIHTSRTEINGDGFVEFFGLSRPIRSISLTSTFNTGSNQTNQTIYLSDNLFVARTANVFRNAATDRTSVSTSLPYGVDTSSPINVHVNYHGTSNTAGNIRFLVRWGYLSPDSLAYTSTAAAPLTGANEQSLQQTAIVPVNSANLSKSAVFELDISSVLTQRPTVGGETQEGDILLIAIERLGSDVLDTYPGDIYYSDISMYGSFWRLGGHILAT